jgi:hypothetical protein
MTPSDIGQNILWFMEGLGKSLAIAGLIVFALHLRTKH